MIAPRRLGPDGRQGACRRMEWPACQHTVVCKTHAVQSGNKEGKENESAIGPSWAKEGWLLMSEVAALLRGRRTCSGSRTDWQRSCDGRIGWWNVSRNCQAIRRMRDDDKWKQTIVRKEKENILKHAKGRGIWGRSQREKEQTRIDIGWRAKKTPFRWKLEGKEKEKLGWAPDVRSSYGVCMHVCVYVMRILYKCNSFDVRNEICMETSISSINNYLPLLPSPVAAGTASLDTWWWQCAITMMIFFFLKLQNNLELCWRVLEIHLDSPGNTRKRRTGEGNAYFLKPVAFNSQYREDDRIIAPFLVLKLLIKGDKITENYLTYLTYRIAGRPHDLPFHWTIIPGARKGSCHCQSRS